MKKIKAKFNCKCSVTGKAIKKGETCYYDYQLKKAYLPEAKEVITHLEHEYTAILIREQEEVYFENFCQQNNI